MTPLEEITLNNNQSSTNLPLILATIWIIRNHFANNTVSTLTIGQFAENRKYRQIQSDILDEVLRDIMTPQAIIKYMVEGETYESNVLGDPWDEAEKLRRFYKYYSNRAKTIWFLDSMESYIKFEEVLLSKTSRYHRHALYLFIYTGDQPERMDILKDIFSRLFNLYVTNVNVLLLFGGKYAQLYTYFPFSKYACNSPRPRFYISFKDIVSNPNFTISHELFPEKVSNMYKCPLTVATWTYAPYVYVKKDPDTGELLSIFGIEGTVIDLLSKKMNFTIRIKEPQPRVAGEIFPNGTATGASRMILQQEANISIMAYISASERTKSMQASTSYVTTNLALAMPLGRPLSAFERLVKPFHFMVWICFSSTFFIGLICIFYIRIWAKTKVMLVVYGQGNRTPLTNFLAILLGGTIHKNLPQKNFARVILSIWILYTFVLRTSYTGELFKILQDGSMKNNLRTLEQVVANNYTIYTFGVLEKMLKSSLPRAKIRRFDDDGQNSKSAIVDAISKPNSRVKKAVAVLEITSKYHNQMNPTRRIKILKERIMPGSLVFYMPPHSYLNKPTHFLILNIYGAGLIKRYINWQKPDLLTDEKGKFICLQLNVLLGLFAIYGLLLLLSFGVFILEVISQNFYRIGKIIDFLNI
ncbi:uncharacterized protein [Musca autumnalis]|uniref:uncharacterized protein n=1 Tax=Musca autumnalis TaxID=221902 RepID=UPI003CECBEEF